MAEAGLDRKSYRVHVALLSLLGLFLFSFFISFNFPVRLISFAALVFVACLIGRHPVSFAQLTGTTGLNVRFVLLFLPGLATGGILAAFYRHSLGLTLFPRFLHFFALTAFLIGSTEELVFRGFLQEYTRDAGSTLSILVGALSHTGYKCFLFMSPAAEMQVDVGFLFQWTLGVGLVFALTRHLTRSIIPVLAAHAVFDILVYGENLTAPWWVW